MFRKISILFAAGVLIAGAAAVLVRNGNAQDKPAEAVSFEGQFLTIVKKSNPAASVDLEKVQLRTIGGKPFLVGYGADTSDNWQKGCLVCVALEDVSEWTAFATLDDLRKAGAPPEKKDGE